MKKADKKSASRKSASLCYILAVLFYLGAVILFVVRSETPLGVVWLCLGSMFLCIGSANLMAAQKEEAAENETAEKEKDTQDSASPKDKE